MHAATSSTAAGSSIPPLQPKFPQIPVTTRQLAHAKTHLLGQPAVRDRHRQALPAADSPLILHPLFTVIPGGIDPWERP